MQRRNFLKQFGLAGAAIGFSPLLAEASEKKTFNTITTLLISGKVHSGGKGIAGVVVTDGRTVTVTNAKGQYELNSLSNAEFVYISIPAGYAFANDKGVPQFYKAVPAGSSRFSADFELEKLDTDDTQHCFVVWADTQMISQEDVELLKSQTVPDFNKLKEGYPADRLFHGFGCGDLVWDKFELFDGYKQAIAETGIPFFNVLGNHDMDLDARTDEYSAKTFKKLFGPTYYSFNRGAIHYVVLDDVFFIGEKKKYIGYITENQLAWLEQDLAQVKPGSTVVVSLHIPTNTGAARRNQKEAELGSVVLNREQLYKILAPFTVHFMSGHTHFNDTWEKKNMMEHNHGTVCGAWWTGPICGDGTPNGYGVYEANGNELKWYYKSTGFDKSHQLRAYEKGRLTANPDEVVANVWNWDKQWKVEWLEDGILKGAMEQKVAPDPWATELYEGPALPVKHKFVEPTLADHMFFAKPLPQAKEIEVRATDRFGEVYIGKISL